MGVEFRISGGKISLPKVLFIREMLRPGSVVKRLLNYELHQGDKARFLEIDKLTREDRVIIRFCEESSVIVGEDYRDILSDLKQQLRGDLRGSVTLVADYYQRINLILDLNAEDGTITEQY
jgi:hypothetical protein